MKLWYQSMSRQSAWGGYPRVLREILDGVRDPDTRTFAPPSNNHQAGR